MGRDDDKIRRLAEKHNIARWTTDLDAALANHGRQVFFDAGTTQMRAELLSNARSMRASTSIAKSRCRTISTSAVALAKKAQGAGIKHGVVQDKLFLPGLLKLKMLRDSGFFGRILSVRGEFGYWVFEGDWGQPAQRPSWNYRKADGGGIILDMLCHWRYVLDNLFGEVQAVTLPRRDAYSRARRREGPALTSPMRTMRPMPPSSSRAESWRTSIRAGTCACGATTS